MKRSLYLLLSCILLCGAMMLSGCNVNININPDGGTDEQTSGEVTQEDIEELIIGKWIVADRDGKPGLTNDKTVYNFVSTTEAYRSASLTNRPGGCSEWWVPNQEFVVDISGNKVTLTSLPDEHQTVVIEFTINSINADEFTADHKLTVTVDGDEVLSRVLPFRYVKVSEDYSEEIIGTWEGYCTSGNSLYDDGQIHRWEYHADGTYVYYFKEGDNWVPSDDSLSVYFVAGNLLCTRWMEGDEENREWWEVSIDGDKMNWTALREDEDGNTFTAEFEMTKVESEDLNVAGMIIGRWMTADMEGQPALTNAKIVLDIVSDNKAYVSASLNSNPESGIQWDYMTEVEISISNNTFTLTKLSNGQRIDELIVTAINDDEMQAELKITNTENKTIPIRFVKINDDYSEDIIGTWEGHCTSEGSVFDDGQEHRWEYKADGTYVYYVKDGDNWVPSDNTLNEYFVAGNLLCTRWMDNGEESREWWEVSIDDDKMNWTALREDEDGNTFTAEFEMTKVEE